jgi:putative transcriptional regulator
MSIPFCSGIGLVAETSLNLSVKLTPAPRRSGKGIFIVNSILLWATSRLQESGLSVCFFPQQAWIVIDLPVPRNIACVIKCGQRLYRLRSGKEGNVIVGKERDYPTLVKEVRRQLSLSQEDLARQLGVSYATVNRWENGLSRPSKLAKVQLAAFCKKMSQQGNLRLPENLVQPTTRE